MEMPLPHGLCDAYLVRWPEGHFAKVGISRTQRWRAFARYGGVPLVVYRTTATKAAALERDAHRVLRKVLDPAFTDPVEATSWLGCRGVGYTECYIEAEVGAALVFLAAARRHDATDVEVLV
jgi:hypothetical protein